MQSIKQNDKIKFINKTYEGIQVQIDQIIVQSYTNMLQNQDPQIDAIPVFNVQTQSHQTKSNIQIITQINQKQNKQAGLNNPIKSLVSKNKKRYEWGRFNFDLSYITNFIIAMGYPSQNFQSFYRNSMNDVEIFFQQKHQNHYKIYNLCKQKTYGKQHFKGNFAQFGFYDHMPPNFQILYQFCEDAKKWLLKDKNNIVAIHCKAGKGRTGTMICCLLLYMNLVSTAQQAIDFYAIKRTFDSKGVTIPSQIRYIKYFQYALKNGITFQKYVKCEYSMKIKKIKVSPIPQLHFFGGCTPWISIENNGRVYKSKRSHELISYSEQQYFEIEIDDKIIIKGDMIIRFLNKGKIGGSEQYMHICLNSNFEGQYIKINGCQIDGVKNDSRYNRNTNVQIYTIKLIGI